MNDRASASYKRNSISCWKRVADVVVSARESVQLLVADAYSTLNLIGRPVSRTSNDSSHSLPDLLLANSYTTEWPNLERH